MTGHDDFQRSLGSYLLGALGPAERHEVDAHLAGCPSCREELAAYAAVPGLLSRLDVAEVTGGTLLPPSSLLPSVLDAVESERAGQARQLSRWRLAAAALATAAALVGAFVVAGSPSPTAPSERPLATAAGSTASGSVAVQPRAWGTELHLRLRDLPPAEGYVVYALDGTGTRTVAASWGPTPNGRAEVPGASALPTDRFTGLVVATSGGTELLLLGK